MSKNVPLIFELAGIADRERQRYTETDTDRQRQTAETGRKTSKQDKQTSRQTT